MEELQEKTEKIKLNAKAPSFKPSAAATAFVPSWLKKPEIPAVGSVPVETSPKKSPLPLEEQIEKKEAEEEEEEEEAVDDVIEEGYKEHLNIVFIGHVGNQTI